MPNTSFAAFPPTPELRNNVSMVPVSKGNTAGSQVTSTKQLAVRVFESCDSTIALAGTAAKKVTAVRGTNHFAVFIANPFLNLRLSLISLDF